VVHKSILVLYVSLAFFSELSGQNFVDVSNEVNLDAAASDPKLMAGGVIAFDYNGDHYPDLLFVNGNLPVKLYRNDWNGKFTDVTAASGLLGNAGTMGAVSGDFNSDGHQDLFFTTFAGEPNRLYHNNGLGKFTDISAAAGITQIAYNASATVGDPDGDGDPDIYVANYLAGEEPRDGGLPNFFYLNDGTGNFTEVARQFGVDDSGCGLGVTFLDANQDGKDDIYIANDFGYLITANELYRNEGDTFRATAASDGSAATINAMGIAKGDYDNDGDQDIYVTNIRENPLFQNIEGGEFFRYVATQTGVDLPELTSWGTSFTDFNLDGFLDLVVANGQIAEAENRPESMTYFENNGNGTFSDLSGRSGLSSVILMGRGLAVADYDLDGLPDIAVNAVNKTSEGHQRGRLIRNTLKTNGNWLEVDVPFLAARVELYLSEGKLVRETDGGSSYLSHSGGPIHFGADAATSIDSLRVQFRDGSQVSYYGINWNTLVSVGTDASWHYIRHERVVLCAEEAEEPSLAFAEILTDDQRQVLLIRKTETEAYSREPVSTIEINYGEVYRGEARTQDAMIVDTIASAQDCPILRPIDVRVVAEFSERIVYPNPTEGELKVSLLHPGGWLKLELFTLGGKLAYRQEITLNSNQRAEAFTLPEHLSGGYLCRLVHNGETTHHKLIIR